MSKPLAQLFTLLVAILILAATTAVAQTPPPQLTDPAGKAFIARIASDQARAFIEAELARALVGAAKKAEGGFVSYFQAMVAANQKELLDEGVELLNGFGDAQAEQSAGTLAGMLVVPMISGDPTQLQEMNKVMENALSSLRQGVPFVVPPAPPNEHVEGTYWMPPSVSDKAPAVDWMFYGILALSVCCFIGITLVTIYFTWKYRRRPGHKAQDSPGHNDAMEITWTVLPSIIVVIIFVLGWRGFVDLMTPPRHALEINVVAQKWAWSFAYPDTGGFTDNTLHVPVNTPVRLVIRSEDVLHDFDIPAFRIKQDAIPRRYTKLWFLAKRPGVYRIYCAEYCGQQHSDMKTWVQVHEAGGYEKYLEKAEDLQKELLRTDPVALGKLVYDKKGCGQCHSVDGSPKTGPSFKGSFGQSRNFADGSSAAMDENYLRESILEPKAKVVAGYNPVMPTFKGKLKEFQLQGLIEFIKSLR